MWKFTGVDFLRESFTITTERSLHLHLAKEIYKRNKKIFLVIHFMMLFEFLLELLLPLDCLQKSKGSYNEFLVLNTLKVA